MKISPLLKVLIPIAVVCLVAFSLDSRMKDKEAALSFNGGAQVVTPSEIETDLARLDRIEAGNRSERILSEDDIEFLTSMMQSSADDRLQFKAGVALISAYGYETIDLARMDRAFQKGFLGCNVGSTRSLFIITYSDSFSEGLTPAPQVLRDEWEDLRAEASSPNTVSHSDREFLAMVWDAGIKTETSRAQAIIVEKSDLRGDDAEYLSAYIRKWIEATDGRVRENWEFIFKVFTAFNTDQATVQRI